MVMGLLAFWMGLGLAARSYPSEYDWRYMTISSLLYQDRNPQGYGWGRAGLVICGVCGLWWVLRSARGQGLATVSLAAGYASMGLCALLPSPLRGIPRPHEALALAAFIALCIGVSRLSFAVIARRQARRRGGALAVACLPLLPVLFAAAAQAYATRADLPWVSLAWRARGIPPYWSFAFWEWVACAIYSALLLWLALGKHSPSQSSGEHPSVSAP
jgi:hypothetical protein